MAIEMEESAASAMVAAGDEQIAEIEQHITELHQRITDVETELSGLAVAAAEQSETLDAARVEVMRLEQIYTEAQAYAQLAVGGGQERRAIGDCTAAKRTYVNAKKALDLLTQQVHETALLAELREEELRRKKHLLNTEMAARHDELRGVQNGMIRAKSELGQEIYDAAITKHQEVSALISTIKTALVDAEVELQQIHTQAVTDLAAWPDAARAIRNLASPDDPTYRIIVATLAYVATLLVDGPEVRYGLDPLPWDLRDVLFVREMEIRERPALINNDRKRRLEQVRDAYTLLVQSQ